MTYSYIFVLSIRNVVGKQIAGGDFVEIADP